MFAPTVESYAYKSPAFLPDTPRNLSKTGQMEKVPWVIGWNEQEGRYFVSKSMIKHARDYVSHTVIHMNIFNAFFQF